MKKVSRKRCYVCGAGVACRHEVSIPRPVGTPAWPFRGNHRLPADIGFGRR